MIRLPALSRLSASFTRLFATKRSIIPPMAKLAIKREERHREIGEELFDNRERLEEARGILKEAVKARDKIDHDVSTAILLEATMRIVLRINIDENTDRHRNMFVRKFFRTASHGLRKSDAKRFLAWSPDYRRELYLPYDQEEAFLEKWVRDGAAFERRCFKACWGWDPAVESRPEKGKERVELGTLGFRFRSGCMWNGRMTVGERRRLGGISRWVVERAPEWKYNRSYY